jgi:hypothetical protein
MRAYRPCQLFPTLMFAWLSGSAALADAPLPQPEDWTACSPSGSFCAELVVANDRTTVLKDGQPLWRMKGWFRDAYLADDGEHVVVGYDGLNLLQPDYRSDMPMLTFWRRDAIVREVPLSDVIADFAKLERTVSHFRWGHTVGFDREGRFLVHTIENRMLAFEVETGNLIEVRPVIYPGH